MTVPTLLTAKSQVVVGRGEHVGDDVLREKTREDVVHTRALEVVESLLQARIDSRPENHGVEGWSGNRLRRSRCSGRRSRSSIAEIMITGTCSPADVPFRRSSTEMPSSPGMRMSRRTTSHVSSAKSSSARGHRGGPDLVAVLLEEATENLPADAVVVGDKDARGHRSVT